jgi:predicted Fe-Mo cluster-binding NifX family protein
MLYAIPTDNEQVSAHFGRAPSYTLVNIEEGKLIDKKTIPNPGHSTGTIPKYLSDLKVNAIITGGMGHRAVDLCNQFNIDTIQGISGPISNVIEEVLKGTLKGGNSLCSPQGGHGYGIPKTDGHGI